MKNGFVGFCCCLFVMCLCWGSASVTPDDLFNIVLMPERKQRWWQALKGSGKTYHRQIHSRCTRRIVQPYSSRPLRSRLFKTASCLCNKFSHNLKVTAKTSLSQGTNSNHSSGGKQKITAGSVFTRVRPLYVSSLASVLSLLRWGSSNADVSSFHAHRCPILLASKEVQCF